MHYFHDIPAVTKPIPRNRALLDRDLKSYFHGNFAKNGGSGIL